LELIYVINGVSQSGLVGWYTDYTNMFRAGADPGILFGGGGGSTNSVEDREKRDMWAVAP